MNLWQGERKHLYKKLCMVVGFWREVYMGTLQGVFFFNHRVS